MRAILLFVSLYLLLSSGLYAQNRKKELDKTQFGFIAGPNFTKSPLASYITPTISWNNYTESHYSVGLDVKAFVSFPIGAQFYFQPELGYSLYRQKQLYSDDSPLNTVGSVSTTDKLLESAVTVDALMKYKSRYFSISGGLQMGLVTAAEIKSRERINGSVRTDYIDAETDFKKNGETHSPVFSAFFGLGKENILQNWGVGVYYSLGLSNYTANYQIRQITKVHGFLVQFSYTIKG